MIMNLDNALDSSKGQKSKQNGKSRKQDHAAHDAIYQYVTPVLPSNKSSKITRNGSKRSSIHFTLEVHCILGSFSRHLFRKLCIFVCA